MDVSDDRRERDVPSLKKGVQHLQAEDREARPPREAVAGYCLLSGP